jgi:hypothetical protein
MAKTTISHEEGEELKRLSAELPEAHNRVAAALRTAPPGHVLEGEALKRVMTEEAKVSVIVVRIKEILGTTGEHWTA